ncbi:unnamed protein product [Trifolium pratense]|uniref:Uncharacterized protein n=1 Tax=Trifolium pratense TaxID=57577 RepID=A0ACB0JVD8_TRIPR|nr:unnamed protein product [Trifolium pratense]
MSKYFQHHLIFVSGGVMSGNIVFNMVVEPLLGLCNILFSSLSERRFQLNEVRRHLCFRQRFTVFRGAEPINKCESDADCEEFTGVWYDMKCIDHECEPCYEWFERLKL